MKLIRVYSSPDSIKAHFLAGLLRANDIPAVVVGERAALGGYIPGDVGVSVRAGDEAAAMVLVERFVSGQTRSDASAPRWTCANCGEQLEAQFTDCWNCQTPRPREDETAPPARKPPDPFVPIDLTCVGCGYNLRALPVDQRCPECGHPIYASLFQMLRLEVSDFGIFQEALQPCLDAVEQKLGFPIEAILFMTSEWASAKESVVRGSGRVNDDAILSALRTRMTESASSPDEAQRTLARWKLQDTEDLRRLVEVLRQQGLLGER